MTFSELQIVSFEAADLINERPIGGHPTSPADDEAYLCPNDLLLGRSTSLVPSGPFVHTNNPRHRYEFTKKIIDNFWRRWTRDYFPSPFIQQKWHRTKEILKNGDVVLIQDSNQIRGHWKLEKVSEVFPEEDGIVRKVHMAYKNPKKGEPAYRGGSRGRMQEVRNPPPLPPPGDELPSFFVFAIEYRSDDVTKMIFLKL